MLRNVSNYQANISIDNKQIQQVNKSKALGTIVDQHLSWKPNTENICKKITSGISALRRVKPFIAERGIHLFLYTMPSYVLTSIIVVKFGMYLVKYNLNDCKSSKIELLELFLA